MKQRGVVLIGLLCGFLSFAIPALVAYASYTKHTQEGKIMRMVIVPNILRDAIYAKVDAVLERFPDAGADRDFYYQQLLEHYDENGVVPDFTLKRRES